MRKLGLLGWSFLLLWALCCLGYDQFERHINEEFVQALPEALQEPGRNAWHLLRDNSFLRIDQPQVWEDGHLAVFEKFADSLETLLMRLPRHLMSFFPPPGRCFYSYQQLCSGEPPAVQHDVAAFDALPVQLRGLLCLFQVRLNATHTETFVLVHGESSFKATEGNLNTWWAVRKARARFEALQLRFCWIHASLDHPILPAMIFAGNKYWERIYDGRMLTSVFLMADRAKTLTHLDQLPAAQFNLAEQDMILAIKSLVPDLAVFRDALFKVTQAAIQSLTAVSLRGAEVGGQHLHKIHSLSTLSLLGPLRAGRLTLSAVVSNDAHGEGFEANSPTRRQVRFVTLTSRLLLLLCHEATKVQATALDHPLRFMWARQEFGPRGASIPVPAVDMAALERAYKAAVEAHPVAMDGLARGLGKDPVQVKESLALFAEPLQTFRSFLVEALIYAALRFGLYDLSQEPAPKARTLLINVHEMAVGVLRLLDEMLGLVTQMREEHESSEWLLISLFDSECGWLELLAVMRALVPRFEAKLRMAEAETYNWEGAPLSTYLSRISTSE